MEKEFPFRGIFLEKFLPASFFFFSLVVVWNLFGNANVDELRRFRDGRRRNVWNIGVGNR